MGHHSDQIRTHIENGTWVAAEGVQHTFSDETAPLGVDGAILHAIGNLGLAGRGLIVPGDAMLPWKGVASMDERHATWDSDITVGVTSHVTERTTDVGKIIVANGTDQVVRCYGRSEQADDDIPGTRALTSAAATSIDMEGYTRICGAYLDSSPAHANTPLSLRDHVMPWASSTGEALIHAYDIQGEILDLGTPANIRYGQEQWQQYV